MGEVSAIRSSSADDRGRARRHSFAVGSTFLPPFFCRRSARPIQFFSLWLRTFRAGGTMCVIAGVNRARKMLPLVPMLFSVILVLVFLLSDIRPATAAPL